MIFPPHVRALLRSSDRAVRSCYRACRLKKKAQHEANKIQLSGLGEEHSKFEQVVDMLTVEWTGDTGRTPRNADTEKGWGICVSVSAQLGYRVPADTEFCYTAMDVR